jgi:hypothetical protein
MIDDLPYVYVHPRFTLPQEVTERIHEPEQPCKLPCYSPVVLKRWRDYEYRRGFDQMLTSWTIVRTHAIIWGTPRRRLHLSPPSARKGATVREPLNSRCYGPLSWLLIFQRSSIEVFLTNLGTGPLSINPAVSFPSTPCPPVLNIGICTLTSQGIVELAQTT